MSGIYKFTNKLNGKIYKDISQGYTGGHCDVYIPQAENFKHYDVNSLYPFAMSKPQNARAMTFRS